MQEELAEPALYVKSGYLEVDVLLQDARWICFIRWKTHGFSYWYQRKKTYENTVNRAALREIYITLLVDINGLDVIDRKFPKD